MARRRQVLEPHMASVKAAQSPPAGVFRKLSGGVRFAEPAAGSLRDVELPEAVGFVRRQTRRGSAGRVLRPVMTAITSRSG